MEEASGPIIGFQLPDLVVLGYLRLGWRKVQQNPDLITDVMARFDADYRRQFMDVLTRGADKGEFLPVFSGWPMQKSMVPGIGVRLAPESEDTARQHLNQIGRQVEGDGTIRNIHGAFQRAVVQISCYGTTQRGAQLMALVTKWLLFETRDNLLNEGLLEQVVSTSDSSPLQEEFMPDWMFLYNVNLSCTYLDSWVTNEGPLISEVEISVYPESGTITL